MKGIYIHIPFCVQKCRYCDFVSYSGKTEYTDAYLDALFGEMQNYKGESADTVFIGGGTPTILSAVQLKKLIRKCFENFDISKEYEFSIEANPGTLDDEKAKTLLSEGVNRISVGVQSFNDNELKAIGRIHSAQTAYNTICRLKELGFENINADIMTALPNQTAQSLMKTVETAVSLPVTQIISYSLIIEDGTPMAEDYKNKKFTFADDDADRDMYALVSKRLAKSGFERYEISNYAKDGFECRHNIKYWQCREYIGLGAAAHSYDGESRCFNTSDLSEYISGNFSKSGEKLTREDKISEFIFMGMRMEKGIDRSEFVKRFGTEIESIYGETIDKFIKGGFIVSENNCYRFTDKGRDVSNSVLCEFV